VTKNQVVIGCKNDINHNPADKYWGTTMDGWEGGGVGGGGGGVVTWKSRDKIIK